MVSVQDNRDVSQKMLGVSPILTRKDPQRSLETQSILGRTLEWTDEHPLASYFEVPQFCQTSGTQCQRETDSKEPRTWCQQTSSDEVIMLFSLQEYEYGGFHGSTPKWMVYSGKCN